MFTQELMEEGYNKLTEYSKNLINYIAKKIINIEGAIGLSYKIDIYELAINIWDMPKERNIYEFVEEIADIVLADSIVIKEKGKIAWYSWFSSFTFDYPTITVELSNCLNLYLLGKLYGENH